MGVDAERTAGIARRYAELARLWRYPEDDREEPTLRAQGAASQPPSEGGTLQRRVPFVEAHVALFGHALRSRCPPYEAEYGGGRSTDVPRVLGDLAGFYRAWGLALSGRVAERPDHVALECEFAHYLAWRTMHALDAHGEESARRLEEARRFFLQRHLGRWAGAFAARVLAQPQAGPYAQAARLLEETVADDAALLGVRCGPRTLPLRPVQEVWEGGVVSCGPCPAPCAPGPEPG